MRDRAAFLRVGLLVLLAIAALLGLILFLAGNRLSQGAKFETYFTESVQGLEVGAPVKFRGVTIGRVTDIGLVSSVYGDKNEPIDVQRASYRLVYVRFIIDPTRVGRLPDNAMAVRTGLRTRLASTGITGVGYIELDFVNPQQYPPQSVPWQPLAEYIPSMPSTLSQVQDAAQQFLAKLNSLDIDAVANSLEGLIDDLRQQLQTGDAHLALTRAATLLDTLDRTVRAADVPQLTADIRATSTSLRSVVQSREVRDVLNNLDAASARLSAASAQLPALVARLGDTSQRAGNATADLQQAMIPVLRDIQAATANLRDTTEALRRYPAQVLLGGPPPREPQP